MLKFLKNILQLLISPDNGWDDIKEYGKTAFGGMSCVIAVASVSCMFQLLYRDAYGFIEVLQHIIVSLVSYWVTFYISEFSLSLWMPRLCNGVFDPEILKTVVCYIISLLCVQTILQNVLPIEFAILTLWPIYVMVIVWRAMKILDVDLKNTEKYLLATATSFIAPSQLLIWMFNSYVLK